MEQTFRTAVIIIYLSTIGLINLFTTQLAFADKHFHILRIGEVSGIGEGEPVHGESKLNFRSLVTKGNTISNYRPEVVLLLVVNLGPSTMPPTSLTG